MTELERQDLLRKRFKLSQRRGRDAMLKEKVKLSVTGWRNVAKRRKGL